jgi:hypothetical protein
MIASAWSIWLTPSSRRYSTTVLVERDRETLPRRTSFWMTHELVVLTMKKLMSSEDFHGIAGTVGP